MKSSMATFHRRFCVFQVFCIFLVLGIAAPRTAAQSKQTIVRFQDLPKLAEDWPKSWSDLVRGVLPPGKEFEKDVLQRLDKLVQSEPLDKVTFPLAEMVVAATLRHHQSLRSSAPVASDPLQAELQTRLDTIRRSWLNYLLKSDAASEALALADKWLPETATGDSLRPAILELWAGQATAELDRDDYKTSRVWLERIETSFDDYASADAVFNRARTKAESLLKESASMPDAQAVRTLEQALVLWPRLPGARDELDRRKGTFRTLLIGVPSLPELASPATAATLVEKQMLDLLFDRLYQLEAHPSGRSHRPQAAISAPVENVISLRRDLYWATGKRVTAADVRHTALLMGQPQTKGRTSLWRDFLEIPRPGRDSFTMTLGIHQALLDPLAPLTFHLLPQYFHGKQLDRADDVEFAKSPIGSGPYQYVGRKVEDGKIYAVLQANAHNLRTGGHALRGIRMKAIGDVKNLDKPLPQLILDASTDQLAALRALGYKEVAVKQNTRVDFLAFNHRKLLASQPLRRAIAHALDREALLNRHFRGPNGSEKYHRTLNGITPRNSWATCPAPRVPGELHDAEKARSFAKQAQKTVEKCELKLHYPQGDPRIHNACEEITRTMNDVLNSAGIKSNVSPSPVSPQELRRIIHDREFDLAYLSEENTDQPYVIALMFDTNEDAKKPGGRNYLGYDGDIKMQELLRAALSHRQFTVVQSNMHALHAHLHETMPFVPLWQLDLHVLAQPSLQMQPVNSASVFAHVDSWVVR